MLFLQWNREEIRYQLRIHKYPKGKHLCSIDRWISHLNITQHCCSAESAEQQCCLCFMQNWNRISKNNNSKVPCSKIMSPDTLQLLNTDIEIICRGSTCSAEKHAQEPERWRRYRYGPRHSYSKGNLNHTEMSSSWMGAVQPLLCARLPLSL